MRLVMYALCALLCANTLWAAPPEHPSVAFVRHLGDEGLRILGDKNLSKREKREALLSLYRRHFDYNHVGRGILGRTIIGTPATDVERLKYLVARNVAKKVEVKLGPYAGSRLVILGREEYGSEVLVSTSVEKLDGTGSIAIVWVLRSTGTSYLVRDVKIEGFSLVLNERTIFADLHRKAEEAFRSFIQDLEKLTSFDD